MNELINLANENKALKQDKINLVRDDARLNSVLTLSIILNIVFIGLWLFEVLK